LDRRRHLSLIGGDRRANGGIVVNVLRHHLDHLGKAGQRNKCRIKPLLLGSSGQLGFGEVVVLRQPVVDVQNLLRIGGGGGDLRQQSIRVESDRGQKLVQLLRRRWRRALSLKVRREPLKKQ
jgi:hypothetical protein